MDTNKNTIQDLLNDTVKFLGKTLVGESLSRRAEISRVGLLQRLEHYIEINGNSNNIEESYEEPPTDVVSQRASSCSSFGQPEDCFKVIIPFSALQKTTVKCGPLSRRQKGVFSQQWRRYWTGLYEHFLLMYASQRDVKPCASVNIQGFVARSVSSSEKNCKKSDAAFEIVCPGKRDYQFIARTVKDMHQWVAAICQASIQHIQPAVPQFPHCTLDRSVLRNVPAPAESDSEIYDDAGPGTQFNGESENIYELQQSEGGELYQDISDVCQKSLVLELKPGFEVKPAEKCPPLPPRRCLPSASQDYLSDQDSVYDDIVVSNQHSEYPDAAVVGVEGSHTLAKSGIDPNTEERRSWAQENIPIGQTKAQPQLFVKHEAQNDDNDEEEIYDDVGITEEFPKAVKLPILHQKLYAGNGGGVQNRIRELQASSSSGGIHIGGHHPNPKTLSEIQYNVSTTYESVNNSEEDTVSSLFQTPTAYHNSKYNISNQTETSTRTGFKHMKNTQDKAKIFSTRTPIATQRPEIPPRSYLKQ